MKKRLLVPEYITNGMRFPEARVRQVLSKPDARGEIAHDEVLMKLLAKHEMTWTDIVIIQERPQKQVNFAFRVTHDLLDNPAQKLTPLEILKEFVNRFGLTLRIGTFEGVLLLHEQVPIDPISQSAQLVDIDNPDNASYVTSFMLRKKDDIIDVVMAFAINTAAYREHIDNS